MTEGWCLQIVQKCQLMKGHQFVEVSCYCSYSILYSISQEKSFTVELEKENGSLGLSVTVRSFLSVFCYNLCFGPPLPQAKWWGSYSLGWPKEALSHYPAIYRYIIALLKYSLLFTNRVA